MVIDALKGVESERRCFRMIGGVLVERTVKDVLPALENNKEQVGSSITVGTIIASVYTLLKKMYT